jgi:hypothetical protein
MDAERKRIADAVDAARLSLSGHICDGSDHTLFNWRCAFAARMAEFEAAVREDERWELMARSEAEPT